jgi:hypothetical protein
MSDLNFVGVKVGDLTGDVNLPSQFGGITTRNRGFDLSAYHTKKKIEAGEEFQVIIGSEMTYGDLQAIQLTLGFDPEIADFVSVSDLAMPGLTEDYFALSEASNGKISALWFDVNPIVKGGNFFTLNFRAKDAINVESFLTLVSKPTSALAYNSAGDESDVALLHVIQELVLQSEPSADVFLVGKNYPNPFANETVIPVQLSENETIVVNVYNATGKLVYSQNHSGAKGINEITIRGQDVGIGGILFARVTAGNHTKSIKMFAQGK